MKISLCVLVGRDENNLERLLESFLSCKDSIIVDEVILIFDRNLNTFNLGEYKRRSDKIIALEFFGLHKQPEMRNIALQRTSCDYIWYVDDDVSFINDSFEFLKDLKNNLNTNNILCYAGRIIEDRQYDGSFLKYPIKLSKLKGPIGFFDANLGQFKNYKFKSIGNNTYPIVDFCQGTSMIFDVNILKSIGGFNNSLGINYASFEDSEPCIRGRSLGYDTVYLYNFKIIHHKLLRVDGTDRSFSDEDYIYSLMKNSKIAYSTLDLSFLYIIGFYITQNIRILKYNDNNILKKLLFNLKGLLS